MDYRLLLLFTVFYFSACAPDFTVDQRDDYGPPKISLQVEPSIGDTTTWFSFSATGTHDADSLTGTVLYRWDLNNDGRWDTPYTINSDWVHVFPDPGIYKIRLEVKDRYEQTSTDSILIESYGAFKVLSEFQDTRDGQWYKTVKIGELTWMAENLNFGSLIPVTDTVSDNDLVEKYCYLNDSLSRGDKGGYFTYYDWIEIMGHDATSITGICPPGWELPSRYDWLIIFEYPDRPLSFFSVGGFSNLNLTLMGFPVRWYRWEAGLPISLQQKWTYFTRSFYFGFLNGPDQIIPYIATSKANKTHGHIFTLNYSNNEIRMNRGIAPVRCIKRN